MANENIIYIFGDVETTGLSEKTERMTEIALVKTDSEFNILDKFQTLINPEREISAKITEITGITEAMVENEPTYDEIIPDVQAWINENTEGKRIVGVAHNAPFDKKFINAAGEIVLGETIIDDWIDTVSVARELHPFWRNHKLDTCAQKFGIVNENHHRAMNDTMVLYHIGKRIIPEFMEEGLDPINFTKKRGR